MTLSSLGMVTCRLLKNKIEAHFTQLCSLCECNLPKQLSFYVMFTPVGLPVCNPALVCVHTI